MDSMRHLSTSLPPTSNRRARKDDHPQELLSSFKAAALSVTNLYKTAANERTKAREAGYQDALDDLLAFLDKGNMGLMDGEGWRIRQWATERLDDAPARQHGGSDDEEETVREEVVETRSSSPEAQRKPPTLNVTSSELADAPIQRPVSEPPQHDATASVPQAAPTSHPAAVPTLDDFSFRSTHFLNTNHDRETPMDVDNNNNANSGTSAVRIAPKPSRAARHTNHNRQRDGRSTNGPTVNFNLGSGAGGKRKMPYPDFFDISGLNFDSQDRKDGGGRGGKRGRHV